jgi:hypothetical protein
MDHGVGWSRAYATNLDPVARAQQPAVPVIGFPAGTSLDKYASSEKDQEL